MMTQGEIATRLGMSRRTLIRWMTRLAILPVRYEGGLAQYQDEVVDRIDQERTAALRARADAVRASVARRASAVVSLKELRRRAGRKKGVAL